MANNPVFKILGLIIIGAALVAATYAIINRQYAKRYAWINLSEVYNGFGMKKDLESKFKAVENERKKILDSLELHLKILSAQLEAHKEQGAVYEFQLKKQDYFTKKQSFEEDNERLRLDYNGQVMTQINQYIKEYAQAQGISIVLGADGSGGLMYADENIEITKPALAFINNRYNDVK